MDFVLFYLKKTQILKIYNKYLRFKILYKVRRYYKKCLHQKETNKKGIIMSKFK